MRPVLAVVPEPVRRRCRTESLPAHAHAGVRDLKIRVHANCHVWAQAQLPAKGCHQMQLSERLDMHVHAAGHCTSQFLPCFARTCKADLVRRHACVERQCQLGAGGHVKAVDARGQMVYDSRHWIGLERVMQLYRRRQFCTQLAHAGIDCGARIDEKGVDPARLASRVTSILSANRTSWRRVNDRFILASLGCSARSRVLLARPRDRICRWRCAGCPSER